MKWFPVGAGVAAVIAMAAMAHADDGSDESFLRALSEAGVEYSNPQEAIATGKAVCESFDEGNTLNQTVRGVKNANPYLSETKAAQFVAIARAAYCRSGG